MAESVLHLLEHWKLLLYLCKDLGIVISWKKLDLELTSKARYLGVLIDAIQESVYLKDFCIFNSQLNTPGGEPRTCDTPVSHSIDIPTEELKSIAIIGTLSFLPQHPLRLASTSTKQPTSYTHTWTDTLIMKYQRRNSATRGQDCPHTMYTPEP